MKKYFLYSFMASNVYVFKQIKLNKQSSSKDHKEQLFRISKLIFY